MRLIDADVLKSVPIQIGYIGEKTVRAVQTAAIGAVLKTIDDAPTIDAVQVVRCGECRYRELAKVNRKGYTICPASGMEITDDDYCSYGERQEDRR